MSDAPQIARLRKFIRVLAEAVDQLPDQQSLLTAAGPLLADLVAHDDWLPPAYAVPDPRTYQQYLLHCDSRERFSVVSFIWGPGQSTPIHNHATWGLIGMLRGAEVSQRYELDRADVPQPVGARILLDEGQVETLAPATGDIHRVWNFYSDRPSISIHVYGANIGAVSRLSYGEDGTRTPFISGYSSPTLPNLWDVSRENT